MAGTHTNPINVNGMFKRAGSWFALFMREGGLEGEILYLGSMHTMASLTANKNRLIDITPTFEGRKVPYKVVSCPAELTLISKYGNIRFTFADTTKIIAEGDPGMGLRFERTMSGHDSAHPRKDGAWEAFFTKICAVIFKGLNGSSFDFNDGKTPWNWEALASGAIYGQTRPAPNGTFTLVIEESMFGGTVRDSYPTYAEAKASMQADWDNFVNKLPEFKGPYEEVRLQCEYVLWSFLVGPAGNSRYPMMSMFAGMVGSQWQMCQNAVALHDHIDLAIDLLLGPIDRAGPDGQLPDGYDDTMLESLMVKPPLHGWAVQEIMKHHDLLKEVSLDKLEMLYTGMGKWADWFLTLRDEDGDGLPVVYHSDETGLDACTMFVNHSVLVSPDVCAYLVLLLEAVGDLAKLLGKADADMWYGKATSLLNNMMENLWDGEHFVGMVPDTREKLFSGSVVHYMPAVLGNRLPKDILDKLVDGLSDKEHFFTEWGIASEDLTSDYYSNAGFGRGCVIPPVMFFLCTGLWDTHRREDARAFADNYLRGLGNANFAFFLDAQRGNGMYGCSSWSCCTYMTLARLLSENT